LSKLQFKCFATLSVTLTGEIDMKKVVIIDDEEVIREGLKTFVDWKKLNCEVVALAESGTEGLYIVEKYKPDIIITDIRMFGMNGLEMIKEIKKKNKKSKIIIVTAYRNIEYAQEAIKLGVFRLLFKPTKTDEIEKVVQEAVEEMEYEKITDDKEGLKQDVLKVINTHRKEFEGKKLSFMAMKILDYLLENYHKEISLQELAEEFYISHWHLSKLIKKEIGLNYTDLINIIRIEQAKRLLAIPRYRINEVGSMVGYNDNTYFSRVFKKLTGMSPQEYRNKFFTM